MPDVDLLVTRALIVTQNEGRDVIADGAVAVQGSTIAAVGNSSDLTSAFHPARIIDAQGQALFPGLINTHTHLFQSAVKGLGEDMAVEQWVRAVTFPTAKAISADEIYLASLVSCMENLRSGATTVLEFMYPLRDPALHEGVIRAMWDSGLRGRFSRALNDTGEQAGVIPELIQPTEGALAHVEQLQSQLSGAGKQRLEIGIAIGAIWGMTAAGLHAAARFSAEHRMPVTMHVNESPFDNLSSIDRFGRATVPMLAHAGLLQPDFLAVHCVHMTEADIALFVEHNVKVSYNAVSNMYLGSGIAPITRLAEAGLTVGVATDGPGSNNSQDMLETIKFSALLQKVAAHDASVVQAQTAVDWATRGGAQALGMEIKVGSIEPGKKADFFLLDPSTPKATPAHDPYSTLVYSAGQPNVRTVVVDGRVVLEDGAFKNLDEANLLREAQHAAQGLARRAGTERLLDRRSKWRIARDQASANAAPA